MKKLFLFLSMFILAGCAGGDFASSEEDKLAKQFDVPQNMSSNLYIFRDKWLFGAAIPIEMYIDGKYIATMGVRSFIVKNVKAGQHTLTAVSLFSNGRRTNHYKLVVLPNHNHYVQLESDNSLKEVSDRVGKIGVENSRLLFY